MVDFKGHVHGTHYTSIKKSLRVLGGLGYCYQLPDYPHGGSISSPVPSLPVLWALSRPLFPRAVDTPMKDGEEPCRGPTVLND